MRRIATDGNIESIMIPSVTHVQYSDQDVVEVDFGAVSERIVAFGLLVAGLRMGIVDRIVVRGDQETLSITRLPAKNRKGSKETSKSSRLEIGLDENALECIVSFCIRGSSRGVYEVNHLDIEGKSPEGGQARDLTLAGFPTGPPIPPDGLERELDRQEREGSKAMASRNRLAPGASRALRKKK
jgi:hypothetical protein